MPLSLQIEQVYQSTKRLLNVPSVHVSACRPSLFAKRLVVATINLCKNVSDPVGGKSLK
jgi:hypothetical protein